MVKLTVATSLAFFQIALLSLTSVGLPIFGLSPCVSWLFSGENKGSNLPSSDTVTAGGLYDHVRHNRDNHDAGHNAQLMIMNVYHVSA